MELFLSFSFLLLSMAGYMNNRSVLNPLFITPFVWGALILFYQILPHSLHSLQPQFLQSISLWVTLFFVGGLLFSFGKESSPSTLYNRKVFDLYYYIVLVFAPLVVFSLVTEALKVGPQYFFLRLRMISAGLEEDDTFSLGALSYVFNFTNVVCLLYTFYYKKVSKKRYAIVVILTLMLGLVTLARTALVTLSISIFVILYLKKILKPKHYFYFVLGFVLVIGAMTSLRESHLTQKTTFSDTIAVYLFASSPAFDTLEYKGIHDFGMYTFRFFYALLNAFGANYEVQETIQPYVNVPIPINVYTVMFTFFRDFGYWGVGLFAFVYGVFFTAIFRVAKGGNDLYILFFSLLFPCILLQFFSEYILQNFSTYLQFTIYLIIPYFSISRHDRYIVSDL